MKNYVFFGILPLLVLSLYSCNQVDTPKGIAFFHGSFQEALQQAEQEEKLVFVDVYTTWCGPCKVMAQTVFPDHEVGQYFNTRFINVKLDAEDTSIDGPRIANTYDVGAYPTLLFLNPDGTEIGRGVAGYDKEGFLRLAKDLLTKQSNNTELLAELSSRYQSGEREKDVVQEYLYIASLVIATSYGSDSYYPLVEKMGPIFDEYVKTHRENETALINEKDFQLFRHYAERRPKSHPAISFVLEHFDSFLEVVPEFALCYFVVESNYSTVLDFAYAGDPSYQDHIALLDTELAHAHAVVASTDPTNAILKDQITPIARSQYLIATKDWAGYVADIEARIENADSDAARVRIKSRAAGRLMNSGDKEYMQLGTEYATSAYEFDKTEPFNVLNYGGVLVNAGKLKDALEVYEEMLSSLEPSSPHYNFRNVLESSIAHVKELMNEATTDNLQDSTEI